MKGSVLSLVPIIYVKDMAESVAFYEKLGAEVVNFSPVWTELQINGATLALHTEEKLPRKTRVSIAFATAVPLEALVTHFADNRVPLFEDITKQPFGRSIVIVDPDGLHIQINEHSH